MNDDDDTTMQTRKAGIFHNPYFVFGLFYSGKLYLHLLLYF